MSQMMINVKVAGEYCVLGAVRINNVWAIINRPRNALELKYSDADKSGTSRTLSPTGLRRGFVNQPIPHSHQRGAGTDAAPVFSTRYPATTQHRTAPTATNHLRERNLTEVIGNDPRTVNPSCVRGIPKGDISLWRGFWLLFSAKKK
jgi:hypothetical protein